MKDQPTLFDEATAEEVKDALLDAIAANVSVNPEKVAELREIQRCIWQLAESGKAFTSDDVVGMLPKLSYPNLIGIGFHQAALKRIIRPIGVASAKRKTRHGALIRVWRRSEMEVADL